MAKESSINVTVTETSESIGLATKDIVQVTASGTGSKIVYAPVEGKRKQVIVNEAPATISTAAGTLISLTESDSGSTVYVTESRVKSFNEGVNENNANTESITIEVTTDAVAQQRTVTLTGTSGTANITVTGDTGDPYLATFDTDLTTTADNFVTSHAATILSAEDVVVTADSGVLTFVSNTAGKSFTAVSANASGDLDGTDAQTVANVEEEVTITPANVEVGDTFSVTCGTETLSVTATTATVAHVCDILKTAIDGSSGDWSAFANGNSVTDNTTNITLAGIDGYSFSASASNTVSDVRYDDAGQELKTLRVNENVAEIQAKLVAL